MPTITALSTSKRNASKQVIHVDGKAVATLSQKHIASLCLEVGAPWEPGLAQIIRDAAEVEDAFEYAMKLINRKPLSRQQLMEKLQKHGCPAGIIERVLTKVTAIGALDDKAMARELVEEIDRRRPAGPLLKRAKLMQRGVAESVIDEIVDASSDTATQIEAARALLASRSKSMAKLSDLERKRKQWSLLARRGFEEEVIEAVLGELGIDD